MLNRSEEQILVLSEAELQQIAGGRAGKGLIVSE
jgi:bacteriocin-like protein